MSWSTPKTDWGVDVVGSADFNRIEENVVTLHKGNGHTSLTTVNPNASKQLQINSIDETFVITSDVYEVDLILTENRQPGNKIYIIGDGVGIVFNAGATPSGDYKAIKIYGGTGYIVAPFDSVTMLIYYNDIWYLAPLTA